MDDETCAYLDAMEVRLMTRLIDTHEQVLQRLQGVDDRLATINQTLTAYSEMARNTNNLLGVLVNGFTDHTKRITDLEKK